MSSNKKIRYCNRCNRIFRTDKRRPKRCPFCKSLFWFYPWMYKINQNTPSSVRKEERHHYLSSTAGVTPGQIIILGVLVVCFVFSWWFISLPPSCSGESQVQLIGVLKGFERNETNWDIRLDNKTYIFNYFTESYMEKMIGENVTITACVRYSHYEPCVSYGLVNCYISDSEEGD